MKHFDFCIGNPPYQTPQASNNRQDPIYPSFYDAAETIADKYILISPARFLFNAGLTSKDWNRKMLDDDHLKVEYYTDDASKVFANTEIKGGVAIMYRDKSISYGAIDEFIPNEKLRALVSRLKEHGYDSIMTIMYGGRSDLKLNDTALCDFPQIITDRLRAIQKRNDKVNELAYNEEYELKSSSFEVLPYLFIQNKPQNEECYRILGLNGTKREYRYILKRYVTPRYPNNNNVNGYKAFFPKASGTGHFGEALSSLVLSAPGESSTPSFISIGNFNTRTEAENAIKYVHCKFARALLGVLKITQDIVPSKWKYVPLQDFTPSSDIDWSKSISEIDQQLYTKYDLSKEEIDFIETHVKEMK